MSDYEQAREAKLKELQAQAQQQHAQQTQQATAERQLNEGLKRILTPEAKERLSNIRLIKPELYTRVAEFVLYLAQSGKVQGKVTEEQVKQVLQKLSEKRETKITRK